jgi:hypothetical protein
MKKEKGIVLHNVNPGYFPSPKGAKEESKTSQGVLNGRRVSQLRQAALIIPGIQTIFGLSCLSYAGFRYLQGVFKQSSLEMNDRLSLNTKDQAIPFFSKQKGRIRTYMYQAALTAIPLYRTVEKLISVSKQIFGSIKG